MKKNLLTLLITCLTGISFAQNNITLLGQLAYPSATCAGVWHYVDSLNNEYAIVGASDRVSIVNVTIPAAPVEVFSVPALPGESSLWREVKTYGKYAYAVSEGGGGLIIVDLTNLPASINSKHWDGDGVIAGQLKTAHTIAVTDGYAYIFGTGSGLAGGGAVICDLADPWNPTYVGQYNLNYIHDGFIRNDTLWAGEIYAGQFSVIDVTNKSNPVLLATQQTPGQFCHNTWLSDNSKYLFTTDEIGGEPLGSFDVSDLTNIELIDEYLTDSMPHEEVHNVRVLNDYLINPSYGSQLVICDGSRPDNIIEIGQYPTGGFLCWDASPYLPSGNIIATDVNGGLFVFQPNYVRACYLEGNVTDSITGLPIYNVDVTILPVGKTNKTDLSGIFKTGTIQTGVYDIEFKKAGYITKTITGVQLTSGQLTSLQVQLVPFNINGTVINSVTSQLLNGASVLISDGTDTVIVSTDVNGVFSASGLMTGNLEILVTKWGYISKCFTMNVSAGITFPIALDPGYYDDFSSDLGWSISSTASSGLWTREIPNATVYLGLQMNPGNDGANDCFDVAYVTGNAVNPSPNYDDVDNGYTILSSPVMDLSTYSNPYINYDRWFAIPALTSAAAQDTLFIYLTNGTDTVILESVTIQSPGLNSWHSNSIAINGLIALNANMNVFVKISDYAQTGLNLLEGGFDKFSVTNGPQNLDESKQALKFTILPNPADQHFTIRFSQYGQLNNAQMQLIDFTGKLIMEKAITDLASENSIDVAHLPAGLYLVTVNMDGHRYGTAKVIVQ